MTFDEFKTDALRTESRPEKLNFSLVGTGVILNLAAETAAMVDLAKKTIFYGKPLDKSDFFSSLASIQEGVIMLANNFDTLADPNCQSPNPNPPPLYPPNLRLLHGAMGMFTEAGELTQALAIQITGADEEAPGVLDTVNFAEEIGDSDWYKAILHDELGFSEDAVREKVIAKLKKRYGDKFSAEAALNRDLVAEREILEDGIVAGDKQ